MRLNLTITLNHGAENIKRVVSALEAVTGPITFTDLGGSGGVWTIEASDMANATDAAVQATPVMFDVDEDGLDAD